MAVSLLAGLFAAPDSRAAAPANDLCATPVVIPGTGPFPYLAPALNISSATLAGDPPVPSFYVGKLSRSVWYRFTPAANALYTLSTCAEITGTTIGDTVMGLYTSPGGCAGPFTQVAFEDENCNSQAEVSAQLLADTTYYVVIWKYFDGSPDDGLNTVQLSVNGLVAPPNDRCVNPTPIALNVPAFGTTEGAEDNYRLDAAAAFTGIGQTPSTGPGRDVVYSFTAPDAGSYSIKLWNADVTEDVLLYAAAPAGCPAGTGPTLVPGVLAAANRSRVNSSEEIFCLPLAAGQTILLFVDHAEASNPGTTFILDITRCQSEQEPNDTPETASPMACGIEGSIQSPGDIDFFALGSFPQDWRVFALIDGEASRNSDFDLRIVSPSVGTLEFDDNNNDTIYGDSSPNVAGTPLTGGPAYLLVNYNGPLEAQPYRVFAVVQPPFESAQLEAEPNNTAETANSGVLNYYRGQLNGNSPSTDVDVFAFNVDEGDVVFLSLDSDPLRNATPVNARLELVDTFGNVLITANDASFSSSTNQSPGTISGLSPFSPGEGIVYRFTEEGTFYARVSVSPTAVGTAAAGDYLLSISRNCRTGLGLGNTSPTIVNLATSGPRAEGQAINLTGAALDPDLGDALEATVAWGDGSSNVLRLATAGALSLNLDHVYPPDTTANTASSPFTVTVTVRDRTGAIATGSTTATVQNAPPSSLQVTPAPSVAVQGQSMTLSGSFADPGTADAHVISVSWGDGSPAQILNLGAGILQFSANHTYGIGGTNITIQVTVTDDDQGASTGTAPLRVRLTPAAARFTSIQPRSGPAMRLTLQGTPEATYLIERADQFGLWLPLGSQTVTGTGTFQLDDTSPSPSNRFYRAVVVQ
jgi:hypothetical protein